MKAPANDPGESANPLQPLRDVEAVLLDAAGTLLFVTPSIGHVYSSKAAKFGFQCTAEKLNEAFQRQWRRLRRQEGHGSPFHTSDAVERAWWKAFVHGVFEQVGAPASFQAPFDVFFDNLYECFAQPDVWRLYDDVLPALDALAHRGVRLAVVSNWDSRLPRLLKAMGIADRFAFVLTSAEAGVSKPHPEIFRMALRRLTLPAEAVVHVGDSLDDDVAGARAAGLHGLLLERGRTARHGPDLLTSLEELPGLIPR